MFKKFLLLASAGLMAIGPAVAAEKVKIGFVTTITTPAGVIGKDMVDAVNLAMEDIGGKMAGLDVELIVEDDGFKPAIGKQKTGDGAIRVGATIPAFSALDEHNQTFESASLAGTPALIKFFRGHW